MLNGLAQASTNTIEAARRMAFLPRLAYHENGELQPGNPRNTIAGLIGDDPARWVSDSREV